MNTSSPPHQSVKPEKYPLFSMLCTGDHLSEDDSYTMRQGQYVGRERKGSQRTFLNAHSLRDRRAGDSLFGSSPGAWRMLMQTVPSG